MNKPQRSGGVGGLREGGGISKGRVIRGKGGENREGGEAREAEEGTRRGR